MVKSPQYRNNIIQQKFIPRQYRFKDFFELREKLIDHPEIFEYLTDQSQKDYIQFCYENNLPEYQDDRSFENRGITEDYVLNKIEAKEKQEEEFNQFLDDFLSESYFQRDEEGEGEYMYWLVTPMFVIQWDGTPHASMLQNIVVRNNLNVTTYVTADAWRTYGKDTWINYDIYFWDAPNEDYVISQYWSNLGLSASNTTFLQFRAIIKEWLWYRQDGSEKALYINERTIKRDYESQESQDMQDVGYSESWWKDDFPQTEYHHMVFWDGHSFYAPNGCIIDKLRTRAVFKECGIIVYHQQTDLLGFGALLYPARNTAAYGKSIEYTEPKFELAQKKLHDLLGVGTKGSKGVVTVPTSKKRKGKTTFGEKVLGRFKEGKQIGGTTFLSIPVKTKAIAIRKAKMAEKIQFFDILQLKQLYGAT